MALNEVLALALFVVTCALLMGGFPVAFTLAGSALAFAGLSILLGVLDWTGTNIDLLPTRIFGTMTNEVLIAVPLFVFMGVMLERSKVAEELLETMGALFMELRGGLGISVVAVGALLAASTGIVGATVVTMGLLSLPVMLKRGYDPKLATGAIAASGTLGQIIPPSIVLILLGDQISIAYQAAQLDQGIFNPKTVSVGDLFAGALIPGLLLVGLYASYVSGVAFFRPHAAPAIPVDEDGRGVTLMRVLSALLPPLALIFAVLGSILGGIATATEAAGVGAIGATLLAGFRMGPAQAGVRSLTANLPVLAATASIIGLFALTTFMDLRIARDSIPMTDQIGILVAFALCALIVWGLGLCLYRTFRSDCLWPVMKGTTEITAMVFGILIGAALFSLVFRGLGGDEMVKEVLLSLPGDVVGALIIVMVLMFILGFFLDFIEITFVVVPIVAPVLLALDVDPIWLGVLMALNLQTSFLTPPFGFALFYLRGVAPPEVKTGEIYQGALPFVFIQIFALVLIALFPGLATWLPGVLYG